MNSVAKSSRIVLLPHHGELEATETMEKLQMTREIYGDRRQWAAVPYPG